MSRRITRARRRAIGDKWPAVIIKLITADRAGHIVVLEHIRGRPEGATSRHLKVIFFNGERGYNRIRGELIGRSGGLTMAARPGVFWPTTRRPPWSTSDVAYYVARFFR